jgi:hypothetical protein
MNKIVDIEILRYYNEKITKYIDEHSAHQNVFIGTKDEYNAAYTEGKIPVGALVIILNENELNSSEQVTALLGTGILGKMILGNK